MAISATICQKSNKKLVPTSYGELVDLPTLNGHEISGDLDAESLGLANAFVLDGLLNAPITTTGSYECDLSSYKLACIVTADGFGGQDAMWMPVELLSENMVLRNDLNSAIVASFAGGMVTIAKIEGAGYNNPQIRQIYGVRI